MIPALQDMGFRVLVPDMIGFGQTDMPRVPPSDISTYSWKSSAADMAELLRQLNIPRTILLSHDWGGAIAQRIYLYYPKLVSRLALFCTPYYPPLRKYYPLEELVKMVPTFEYQIALCEPNTEHDLADRGSIERFFKAIHRGIGDGGPMIQVRSGFVKALGNWDRGKLLSQKDLEYYVDQYARNGFHGPLNWYKIRYQNHLDEKKFSQERDLIKVPTLYVGATKDVATPPSMAGNQHLYIRDLTSREVESSHWVLVEVPNQLLAILEEWLPKGYENPRL